MLEPVLQAVGELVEARLSPCLSPPSGDRLLLKTDTPVAVSR